MMDSLLTLQDALRRLRFSQRLRLYRELQRRASQQPQMDVPAGQVIAWPDVLLYLTPAVIAEAVAAVEVTPEEQEETSQP